MSALRRGRVVSMAAVAVVALGSVVVGSASPAAAAVINVQPGQSIQAAVNKAHAGDTIRVASGIFHESVEVTKSLTILGAGAGSTVLQPPPKAAKQGFPCQDPSVPVAQNGFCVRGVIDQNFNVVTPVGPVRVSGFSVKNFAGTGVLFFGASSPQLDHNILNNNAEYGGAGFVSTNHRFTDNIANKNGEAGLYVGDSPGANAVVAGNQTNGQTIGIFLRDASGASSANPAHLTGNAVRGNCIGIFFLNTGGVPRHWEASGNQSSANNLFCPPHDPGDDPVSGVGIAVVGARDINIHDNLVTNNVPSQPVPISGGIVVQGATAIKVTNNVVRRNQPFDLVWDKTGTATFTGNACTTSSPAGLCK